MNPKFLPAPVQSFWCFKKVKFRKVKLTFAFKDGNGLKCAITTAAEETSLTTTTIGALI
jgi:hypothetical protein